MSNIAYYEWLYVGRVFIESQVMEMRMETVPEDRGRLANAIRSNCRRFFCTRSALFEPENRRFCVENHISGHANVDTIKCKYTDSDNSICES